MKLWFPTVQVGTGTDVFTLRLAEALRRHGHEAHITWLPRRIELAPWLARAVPPPGTDIIHANSWNGFAFARYGRPLVVTAHHCVHDPQFAKSQSVAQRLYHRTMIRFFEKRSFECATAITAVSEFTRQSVLKAFGSREIHVIYNWVDTDRFRPIEGGHRSDRPFRLLFVGNRSIRKGGDVLPELMRQLGQDFQLQYTSGLRAETADASLPPNMIPLGRIAGEDGMIRAYQGCDALLAPSRLEGFGYAALEAMACGKPVVAFRASAMPEVVLDGITGLLTPLDDIAALAVACRRLAADSQHANRLGQAARQRAVMHFSEAAALEKYMKIYAAIR